MCVDDLNDGKKSMKNIVQTNYVHRWDRANVHQYWDMTWALLSDIQVPNVFCNNEVADTQLSNGRLQELIDSFL